MSRRRKRTTFRRNRTTSSYLNTLHAAGAAQKAERTFRIASAARVIGSRLGLHKTGNGS
jgi:hypothetical protein